MRKITEKDLKGWFPRDNRFLHYCAKHYGYSFYNDDVVAEAAFRAARAITKIYHEGREFESEEEMYGFVMSTFRFSILNAYKQKKNDDRLESRPMSDYEFASKSGDETYNTVMDRKDDGTIPYDNTKEFLRAVLEANLPYIERECVRLHYLENMKGPDVQCELDITYNEFRAALIRGINKLKKAFKHEHKKPEVPVVRKNIQPTKRPLQKVVQCQPFETNKAKRDSYSKAMSFLHLD